MEEERKVPKLRFPEFTDAWEQRKLGEAGETYSGLSGKTKEDFGHGEAKFITYMNVFSNAIADKNGVDKIEIDDKQNQVKFGDILFTMSSETREEAGLSSVWLENEENIYLNSFCFGYRLKEEIDLYYLAYLLRAETFRDKIVLLAQGISRYNISKNKVMEVIVRLPSLPEQKKIGQFFRNLDNLITLHQRKLENLKNLKKGLLQKMFPKDGEKFPEIRFPEFTDAWEQRKLGEVGDVYTGNTPSTDILEYWSAEKNNFVWVTPTDIKALIIKESERYLSEEGWKKARVVPEKSVLITSIASIGKNTINIVPVAFNQQINAIVPIDNDAYFILSSMIYNNDRFCALAGHTATPIINKTTFEKFSIMLPTFREQQKIGKFFEKMDNLITLHQRKLDNLQKLKKALLQQMFV